MNILCFFGLHNWKKTMTTISTISPDGLATEYFVCKLCYKEKLYSYKPNARHVCGCGKDEGTCGRYEC